MFENVSFLKSVASPEDLPFLKVPEVAIIGRSNVGKSSLINYLFKKKNLAKTSSTPGKTRLLNFFLVGNVCALVDLPGYGFATASKEEQEKWANLIDTYLNNRGNVKLILLLLDIRHMPSIEDRRMLEWLEAKQMKTILVFTKCDKLGKNEKENQTKRILSEIRPNKSQNCLGIKEYPYVHCSAKEGVGRKQLLFTMQQLLLS